MPETKTVHISAAEAERQADYIKKCAAVLREKYPESPPLAYVHSYGCQGNVADGERMKGLLAQMGYGFAGSPDGAKLVLYNTCAVRENAEDRVFGNVGALKHNKRRDPDMVIALCGCMMQQAHVADRIYKSYPFVNLVFGTHVQHTLPELLYRVLTGQKRLVEIPESDGVIAEGIPAVRDGNVKAFVPVMYGCNNFCTYCIVPYVRGRERSRKPEDIIAEVKELVDKGYKEITLLGQNVNSYGKGLDEPVDFAGLLRQINGIDGDFWIRFMTSHPKDITHELIDTIAGCQKVCNNIHLPVQSGCDRVLKAMNRGYTVKSYLELISYAKEKIKGLSLTRDIIVGFPGESYEEFLETLDLIRRVRYYSLFMFIYSKRTGTKAAGMDDPIPAQEKTKWFKELLDTQNAIGIKEYEQYAGKTLRVLVDGVGKSGDGYVSGRSENNVIVELPGGKELIGRFVDVKITVAHNWALSGEIVPDK